MKFKFESVDSEDNCKNTVEFTASTWVEALDYFAKFLRGNGYMIEDDSIAVNIHQHPFVSTEGLCNITEFNPLGE